MTFDYTWILSATTAAGVWMSGYPYHLRKVWILGCCNQLIWAYLIYDTKKYGLIPLSIILFGINASHLWRTRIITIK